MKTPLKTSKHKLVLLAAGLGTSQGVVWTVLAILGISYRFMAKSDTAKTHLDFINNALSKTIQENPIHSFNVINLFGIVIVYLIASPVWVSLSLMLVLSLKRHQRNNLNRTTMAWGVVTLLTCIYDVIVTGIIASDYATTLKIYNKDTTNDTSVYTLIAYGILFSLSARGYVLWVINVVVAILMIRDGSKRLKKNPETVHNSSRIYAFNNERPNSGQVNQGYSSEERIGNFNTRRGRFALSSPMQNSNAHTDNVIKIQRPVLRNHPQRTLAPNPLQNYKYPALRIPKLNYLSTLRITSALKRLPPPPVPLRFNHNRH